MLLEMNSTSRVQAALAAAGLPAKVVEMPQTTRTAADAAKAIGCEVAQIAKSLVFRSGDEAVLVIASGTNRVDASRLGLAKADAEFVRERTGFAIGGVPPVGHSAPIRTLIDEDLLRFDRIWAAAGTPNAVFELTPADLRRLTGGTVTNVGSDLKS
ncbi:MAG TPA: YbaK/EbsC family protein [Thermoanaerobaculia bacterium]|nr:YbaK/EbsC family protein [Thermoanaerobaculia bacterium]